MAKTKNKQGSNIPKNKGNTTKNSSHKSTLANASATTKTTKTITPRRKELQMAYKPKLILSDNVIEQINYFHNKVQSGTEWSAILIYSIKNGSIDTIKDEPCEILIEEAVLMDIGTSTYTEYDMEADDTYATEKWMDALEAGKKLGHLHTHHNMNCYFSATDTQELHDNAPQHNYYLSLIVNYKSIDNWCAKIAVAGEERTEMELQTTTSWKGSKGDERTVKSKPEKLEEVTPLLFTMNCEIEPETIQEENAPEGLAERIDEILAAKKKYPTTVNSHMNHQTSRSIGGAGGSTTNKVGYTGGGNNQSLGTKKPYSAPGTGLNDPEEEEWTGTILDLQGNPVTHNTDVAKKRGTITERYSPGNIASILIKLLDKDLDSTKTLEHVCMELEMFDDRQLDAYMTPVADNWVDDLSQFFAEELTPIHLHAISCSMYDLIQPYMKFNVMDPLDDILLEHLAEEGEYNPLVIKQMTGLLPVEQMCLTVDDV